MRFFGWLVIDWERKVLYSLCALKSANSRLAEGNS